MARGAPETVANRKSKKTYTPEQCDEYRKQQRDKSAELMKDAVTALLTSEGWQAWAAMRGRLHSYSLNNTLLILAQMPDATMVASGKFWIDHGRMMRKGTQALRVSAPLFRKPTAEEMARGRQPDAKVLFAFKLVPVFDISQTDGDDLPIVEPAPIEGDTHAAYLRPLEVFAHSLGFSVSSEQMSGGMGGYCDAKAKHIALNADYSDNAKVRVLVHELAHALGIGYEGYGREQSEVLVETATFIVCTSIGLATDASSVPYVTGWGGTNAVAAIEKFAATVDEVARKIERAVKDAEVAS